jgi:hypothetical protein
VVVLAADAGLARSAAKDATSAAATSASAARAARRMMRAILMGVKELNNATDDE